MSTLRSSTIVSKVDSSSNTSAFIFFAIEAAPPGDSALRWPKPALELLTATEVLLLLCALQIHI